MSTESTVCSDPVHNPCHNEESILSGWEKYRFQRNILWDEKIKMEMEKCRDVGCQGESQENFNSTHLEKFEPTNQDLFCVLKKPIECERNSIHFLREANYIHPATETIDEWIARVKPSQIDQDKDKIDWLAVHNPLEQITGPDIFEDKYREILDSFVSKYEVLGEKGNVKIHEKNYILEITEGARKQGYTCGRWILYESPKRVDDTWAKVARATFEGKLGCSASVCPSSNRMKAHLVSVCTSDFTDEKQVHELLKALLEIGITPKGFLPDVFNRSYVNLKAQPIFYKEMLLREVNVTLPIDFTQSLEMDICFDYLCQSIEDWIAEVKPSQMNENWGGVDGIAVFSPCENVEEYDFLEEEYSNILGVDVRQICKEFNQREGVFCHKYNLIKAHRKIMKVVKKQKYTCGKWSFGTSLEDVDAVWSTVVRATFLGLLGFAAKVFPVKNDVEKQTICIYTQRFTDNRYVRRLLENMKTMHLTPENFQADIHHRLKIEYLIEWCMPRSGFTVFDPTTERIEDWIASVKPSEIFGRKSAGIAVNSPYEQFEEPDFCEEEYEKILDVITEKERQMRQGETNTETKTISEIRKECVKKTLALAKRNKFTLGKWMIFCPRKSVDKTWAKVAKAVFHGKLGLTAHVTGSNKTGCVISVSIADFSDYGSVMQIFEKLQHLQPFGFKPEIYSYLDILKNNEWGVDPMLYHALRKPGNNGKCMKLAVVSTFNMK